MYDVFWCLLKIGILDNGDETKTYYLLYWCTISSDVICTNFTVYFLVCLLLRTLDYLQFKFSLFAISLTKYLIKQNSLISSQKRKKPHSKMLLNFFSPKPFLLIDISSSNNTVNMSRIGRLNHAASVSRRAQYSVVRPCLTARSSELLTKVKPKLRD